MNPKLSAGQKFPAWIAMKNIHGESVSVPDSRGRWTHLQLRRFAGCPICNLHVQSFVVRHAELTAAGIREIVVFHSSDEELLPYQGRFPFDVIGDPQKALYRQYGIETSPLAILNPAAWPAIVKGNLRRDKPAQKGLPKGGPLGLPADFLVSPEGTLSALHHGKHADDQWSVDEVLSQVKAAAAISRSAA